MKIYNTLRTAGKKLATHVIYVKIKRTLFQLSTKHTEYLSLPLQNALMHNVASPMKVETTCVFLGNEHKIINIVK